MCMWAKLLPSCPALCNPVDCCPPGSSVHGILQPRIWILDLPDPRTGPASPATPALAGRFFPAELLGKPKRYHKQSEERSLQWVWGIRNIQNQQTISQRNKSVRKSVEKRQPSRKIGKECKEANHRKKQSREWLKICSYMHLSTTVREWEWRRYESLVLPRGSGDTAEAGSRGWESAGL